MESRFRCRRIGSLSCKGRAPPRQSRHRAIVRNPIYVALVSIILGQALLFANRDLFVYGVLLWLFFHLAVIASEEPALRQALGPNTNAIVPMCRAGFPG